ncbi:hypothetical protein [Caulobacter sp. LARHSG274]
MSLNLHPRSLSGKVEQPNIVQRVAAIFGLAGLVLAWAVVLLPCAVWLLFSLISNRFQATPARQQV